MGPLAHWEVVSQFQLSEVPEGAEQLLFLYPLPSQAAIASCSVSQDGTDLQSSSPMVQSVDQLPDDVDPPTPSKSLLKTFAQESLPVFSLRLDSYRELMSDGKPLSLSMVFSNGLPTVDGRISLTIPLEVDTALKASGTTVTSVEVEIEDGAELVDDPITTVPFEQTRADEALNLKGVFPDAEQDIEITFRPGRTEMPVIRLHRSDENFLFSIFPPTSIPASPQRRDLVFAVDASENVLAKSFQSLREALASNLRTLDDNDRFALVTFGREIDGYQGGEFCEIAEVEQACEWLANIEPKGRADIAPLLARIQSLPSQPDRQLCVFLLAAGHVGNEPALLKALDFDQSDRRYYTVGIGSSVQQAFLRRLALLTRGRCEVSPTPDCSAALTRLLGQTRALLAEVTFEEQEGKDFDVDLESLVPSRMTSLTPQGPVHCLGVGHPSSLRYRSKDETGVFFAGTVNARSTENPALGAVWAGLKVQELLDSVRLSTGSKRQAYRTECSTLASKHGILMEDTVMVLETANGLEVQMSASPYRWKKGEEVVAKADDEASPPFDWRKGLVARDGLFKGARLPSDGESSSETGVRHGLRSRQTGSSEAIGKPSMDSGKPMLDRSGTQFAPSKTRDLNPEDLVSEEPVVEDSLEAESVNEPAESVIEPPTTVEEASSKPVDAPGAESTLDSGPSIPETASSVTSPVNEGGVVGNVNTLNGGRPAPAADPVTVSRAGDPVYYLTRDPLADGRDRLDSYFAQSTTAETKMALATLAGLDPEIIKSGPDLPRILAQTVGHLEKRGYFSAAVSVLGLLLQEFRSPEALKKMESLLVGWAQSLNDEYLPEALHILSTGRRICPDSELLPRACESLLTKWEQLAGEQRVLPEVLSWRPVEQGVSQDPLMTPARLEVLGLQQRQEALSQELSAMKSSMEAQFAALPSLLEKVLDSRPVSVSTSQLPPASPVAPLVSGPTEQAPTRSVVEHPAVPVKDAQAEAVPVSVPAQPIEPVPATVASLSAVVDPVVVQTAPVPGSSETAPPPTDTAAKHVVAQEVTELELPLPSAEPTVPAVVEPALVEAAAEDVMPAVDVTTAQPTAAIVEPTESAPLKVSAEPDAEVVAILVPATAEDEGQDLSQTPKTHPEVEAAAAIAEAEPSETDELEEGSDLEEALSLTRDELMELLQAEPKDESAHRSVRSTIEDPKERINFYRDLVRNDKEEAYHSLSLARAYREADQTKVAVVHYQKFLRAEKDSMAYEELADAYDELGKTNLSESMRKAAELHRT